MSEESARRIRELREKTGESQQDMANILKMNAKQQYAFVEKGRELSYERLILAAQHFGVTTDYLTGASKYKTLKEASDAIEIINGDALDSDAAKATIEARKFVEDLFMTYFLEDTGTYDRFIKPLRDLCMAVEGAAFFHATIVDDEIDYSRGKSPVTTYIRGDYLRFALKAFSKIAESL